jgi:hypothetical protein
MKRKGFSGDRLLIDGLVKAAQERVAAKRALRRLPNEVIKVVTEWHKMRGMYTVEFATAMGAVAKLAKKAKRATRYVTGGE